jgi:hypothetical protein
MRRLVLSLAALLGGAGDLPRTFADSASGIEVTRTDEAIQIETKALSAQVRKTGYVSGVARGSLVDKKTGAKDLGFGLHIMDFLLAPGWAEDEYSREPKWHGKLPKHYVEGPQVCTQAKTLTPEVIEGKDFVAVKLKFKFHQVAKGFQPGSTWEQTLLFLPDTRYFLSSEKITSVNDVDNVFYRIDMPGHIQHKQGDTFTQVYLSYQGKHSSEEFLKDFAPDEKFLYHRDDKKIPERMIRGYQVKRRDKPGPWLAGMTLDPSQVSEAWCHQRGYVCFIQELHGRKIKKGESMGAAYIVGWFDSVEEMETVYDRYKGKRAIQIEGEKWSLK